MFLVYVVLWTRRCVFVCALITEKGRDKVAVKAAVNWSTDDDDASCRRTRTCRVDDDDHDVARRVTVHSRCRPAVSEPLRERDKLAAQPSLMYRRAAGRQCVCLSVYDCHQCSINTSLYPMIGSCTTSSCHVDSVPRPPCDRGSRSTLTDCSTCCVYEYELDSLETGLDSVVDCSALKGTSLSWSTVHSAPAVLSRLTRYKAPVSHSSVYNCTSIHSRRDRRATHVRDGDRRDDLCCYHSPFYCYQPPTYAYSNDAAVAAAAGGDDDDDDDDYDERRDKVYPSLAVAKPVLADTQYWV